MAGARFAGGFDGLIAHGMSLLCCYFELPFGGSFFVARKGRIDMRCDERYNQ